MGRRLNVVKTPIGITGLFFSILALLLVFLVLWGPMNASADGTTQGSLVFVGAQVPSGTVWPSPTPITAAVTVGNIGSGEATMAFTATLWDANGVAHPLKTITASDDSPIDPNKSRKVVLTFEFTQRPDPSVLPLKGPLFVSNAGTGGTSAPSSPLNLTLVPPNCCVTDQLWPILSIAAPVIYALVGLLALFYAARGTKMSALVKGYPQWDFKTSWLSNITAAGAVLGTLLSTSQLLPSTLAHLTQTSYATLSIFFGLVILVVPTVYNASVRVTKVAGETEDAPHGRVGALLASSALALFAVSGELLVAWLITDELKLAGSLSDILYYTFTVILGSTAVVLLVYMAAEVKQVIAPKRQVRVRRVRSIRVPSQLPTAALLEDLGPAAHEEAKGSTRPRTFRVYPVPVVPPEAPPQPRTWSLF
jgi:hypothetical protein